MAKKGTVAKQNVLEKISKAFGQDYVGEYNKKAYVFADDGGEKVQIAISLTCPNSPVGTVNTAAALNFEDDNPGETVVAQTKFEPAEVTEEEKANIAALMESLNL